MNTRQSKAAFTLVEVMIAITLLTGSMLAIGSAVIGAAQMGKAARERTAALNVCRAELEICHTKVFDDAYLNTGTAAFVRTGYSGTRQIVLSDNNRMKQITVRVNYPSSWGRTAVVQIQGVMSEVFH